MSKVKIQGHASGTGVLTVTAPNTSTDRTITLPDSTATIATTTDVAARLPSIVDGGNATAITIDASENVGIGVTPHSTHSSFDVLEFNKGSIICQQDASSGHFLTSSNTYYSSGGGPAYQITEKATSIQQIGGEMYFKVAPSGTADSAITWTTAMEIDNSGSVTTPSQPSFCAHVGASQNITSTASTTVTYNTELHDSGADYANTGTFTFTAPITGRYLLSAHVCVDSLSNEYIYFNIRTSNKDFACINTHNGAGDYSDHGVTVVTQMDANDTAYVTVDSAGDSNYYVRGGDSFFSGHLLG